jgi:PelA/Pel-15E family pectate lyase
MEPSHDVAARSIPLDREPSWYASDEARHIADVIVSFQTPAGGWGKNIEMSKQLRRPGEAFTSNNLSQFIAPGDFDNPREPDWNYVGTIDNDATTSQMRFLARTISALGTRNAAAYRAAFLRGMNYLFEAQFPNGGWPQVWPLEGGYHDAITFNDNAMIEVMELMRRAADGAAEYSFVPDQVRKRAAASFALGIQCVLATQIKANGRRTVWPQQDDALTLQPVSARNYEPPAQCASESTAIVLMLMNDLPHPRAEQQEAIRAAAAWFRKTAIYGQSWGRTPEGRRLVPTPGVGPIWARFYQVGTDRPVFGDRDKSIHDNVNEISEERRNGYRWYSADPQSALDRYETWITEHMESK